MAPHKLTLPETDCTPQCRSSIHGEKVTTALTCGKSVNQKLLLKYLVTICQNFSSVKDKNGRNALHTASACGKEQVVEWLLKFKDVMINARDLESGASALHLALFHGQLHVARNLIQAGSNIYQGDNSNFLPVDYVTKDRLPRVDYNLHHMCEPYVWGTNANFTIGQGHIQNKMSPELLETFRKDNINVKMVAMSKFHSIFVDGSGRVFACGHGQGGRLGLDSELAAIYPTPITSISDEACEKIAVGLDHTVLLMESGHVFTFGSNTYHQLGLNPPPVYVVSPKQVPPLLKSGKTEARIKGIAASRFHTVFWSTDAIFTCGLNAGHLGHLKGEKTIIVPKQVTSLILKETTITHVVASEGATLVATNKGDIYVLHEYQTRKIASKQIDLDKVYMIGGHLDPKGHPDLLKESGGRGLQIALLSKVGKISVWTEKAQVLTRCITNLSRPITVIDVAVSLSGFLIISSDGEGYMGTHIPRKERRITIESQAQDSRVVVKNHSSALVDRVEREHCDQIKLKRIPNIHRAVAAACDIKGTNFCVIQTHPSASLLQIPQVSPSLMQVQMRAFFEESVPDDFLHDIVFEVGYSQFAAHKYILGHRAESLLKFTLENGQTDEFTNEVFCRIEDVPTNVFEQILRYVYTGTCQPLEAGTVLRRHNIPRQVSTEDSQFDEPSLRSSSSNDRKSKKKKTKRPVAPEEPSNDDYLLQPFKDGARHFGLYKLVKLLDEIAVINGIVKIKNPGQKFLPLEEPRFRRQVREELADVVLVSEGGKELEAHRCILAARLEYFRSMFGLGWIETSSTRRVTLPLPFELLEVIVDYLYEDDAKALRRIEDVEFLCNVIVVADQFLIGRLKELCEEVVTSQITLKNVTEVVQFADTYNAMQLKRVCMEYICLNLSALLESRALDMLTEELMDELSMFYRESNRLVGHRYVTPRDGAPTEEVLEQIFGCEIDDESGSEEIIAVTDSSKQKKSRAPKARKRTDSTGNKELPIVQFESSFPSRSTHAELESPKSQTGEVPQTTKYKWSKVTSSARRRQNSVSNDEQKKVVITPIKEKSQEPPEVNHVVAIAQSPVSLKHVALQNGISPAGKVPPTLVAQKMPVKPFATAAFPTLSEVKEPQPLKELVWSQVNQNANDQKSAQPFTIKKPAKLSQKQRKQLAAQGITPNAISISEPASPSMAPWAADTSLDVAEAAQSAASVWSVVTSAPSLVDIMKAEEGKKQQVGRTRSSPVIQRSTPVPTPRQIVASPQSPIKSPPFFSGLSGPNVRGLSEIMEEERLERDMLKRAKAKPLRLTQIEDQAIEELLDFYGADICFDERITVRRVTGSVATPTWFR